MIIPSEKTTLLRSGGHCCACNERHTLSQSLARNHCVQLMKKLQVEQRIDFDVDVEAADPAFHTDYLFGDARGKMFGILVCRDEEEQEVILKAFSGQYNAVWHVHGWVPPVVDDEKMDAISFHVEKEIKSLGQRMAEYNVGDPERTKLKHKRRELSRALMAEIHDLYILANFKGDRKRVRDVFAGNGIPTGTGDCCAPKLLQFAALNHLHPVSMAEFYWGKENRSGSKQHGRFYPACKEKCQPILGYMLCGAARGD